MLHEVAATPKPGLVDRNNCGAHADMDIFTFCTSASVLQPFFTKIAYEGSRFNGNNNTDLLKAIRPLGIEAEKRMFLATKGVNTHKGLIFSLGILISATANILSRKEKVTAEEICDLGSSMCRDIVKNELKNSNKISTNGEKLYQDYW